MEPLEHKRLRKLQELGQDRPLLAGSLLYLLLQVAHLFMQLLARSDLIEPVSTLTFLADLLLEALRNALLPDQLFDPQQLRFQIRFTRAPT